MLPAPPTSPSSSPLLLRGIFCEMAMLLCQMVNLKGHPSPPLPHWQVSSAASAAEMPLIRVGQPWARPLKALTAWSNTERRFQRMFRHNEICRRFGAAGMVSRQISLHPEWSNRCDWSGSLYSESEIRIQLSVRLFSLFDPLCVAHGTEQNLGRH